MDAEECIATRRSRRAFMDVPVEWEKVGRILEAARVAPSAGNLQNWKFLVTLDKAQKHKIAEACLQQWWMEKAPVLITIAAEPEEAAQHYGIRGERLYSIQNCAMAAENMLLMAHALGLGACFVAAFEEDRLKTVLGMPDTIRPQCVIAIGYSDEKPVPLKKYYLENVVFFESWMNRIKDMNATMGYSADKVQNAIKKGKEFLKGIAKK